MTSHDHEDVFVPPPPVPCGAGNPDYPGQYACTYPKGHGLIRSDEGGGVTYWDHGAPAHGAWWGTGAAPIDIHMIKPGGKVSLTLDDGLKVIDAEVSDGTVPWVRLPSLPIYHTDGTQNRSIVSVDGYTPPPALVSVSSLTEEVFGELVKAAGDTIAAQRRQLTLREEAAIAVRVVLANLPEGGAVPEMEGRL